jgi:tRNA-dihydrouridine synthase A
MREPDLVAECVAAMGAAVRVPVTVKCRLGVDDQDPGKSLFAMADAVAAAGVETLVVHARKAWLDGLSPKENRDIPPLDYALVYRLKAARPGLTVVINGGVDSLEAALGHLDHVDGVMLGRAAYHDPAILLDVDPRVFGEASPAADRFEAVERFLPYVRERLAAGVRLAAMTRHMLGLFRGEPGARAWRRILTVEGAAPGAGVEVIERALEATLVGATLVGATLVGATRGAPEGRDGDQGHGGSCARLVGAPRSATVGACAPDRIAQSALASAAS